MARARDSPDRTGSSNGCGRSPQVVGKVRAAVADARFQELRADASIQAHAVGDFLDVGAESLADAGDLVDEADLGGQKRVRGVLDHLGSANVGLDNGRLGLK